jgi:hypothetical protein
MPSCSTSCRLLLGPLPGRMSALRAMPVERFGRDEALLNIDEWCLHSHAISQRNLKTVIRSVDQRKEMPNDILCARLQHQPMCGLVGNRIEKNLRHVSMEVQAMNGAASRARQPNCLQRPAAQRVRFIKYIRFIYDPQALHMVARVLFQSMTGVLPSSLRRRILKKDSGCPGHAEGTAKSMGEK